ncbi:B12-binding domain-containing radical SAM protein [Anaeromyxobacter oryzisoli]|uniref:B12-binding domain-containing radical SAM protein n=1 Tax=Anaeromyxobacter oryzisoli TaxID=2925408 RepID=UPI002413A29C|nr:radical SAM protein [Anaeromyxobacter sp. SG63]
MKVTLISPEFPFSGRVPMVPPILEYLGALTLREDPEVELQLVDANQTRFTPEDVRGELVGLSVWTATAPWVYRFADACRARGLRVVLGGIHASALPDEAALHADAVVVGEAESAWGEVLRDAASGRLRARYDGVRLPLAGLPTPIDAKLRGQYHFRAFFTMRGCPYRCSFCTVRRFFGDDVRYRPVDEVAAEVEARAGSVWFNGDDNIWGADPDRAVALFDAIAAGRRRSWYGFGDLRSVQGPEGERVLKAARRSGLYSVWAGWETDSAATLAGFRAEGKQGKDRVEAVKRIQGEGIEVVLFTMLGAREDGLDAFQRTLELADRLRVGIHPVLATPLPGTELYEAYRPYLVPGLGWEAFTGVRAVFEHPDPAANPERREREYHELVRELFRASRIVDRLRAIPRAGFPRTHLLSLMAAIPMKVALGKARAEWQATHAAAAAEPPPPRA